MRSTWKCSSWAGKLIACFFIICLTTAAIAAAPQIDYITVEHDGQGSRRITVYLTSTSDDPERYDYWVANNHVHTDWVWWWPWTGPWLNESVNNTVYVSNSDGSSSVLVFPDDTYTIYNN